MIDKTYFVGWRLLGLLLPTVRPAWWRARITKGGNVIRALALLAASAFGAIAIGTAGPAIAAPMPQAPYPNCTVAKQNGDCDIPSSSDKYQSKLDRDQDGLGCEC
jgi:hypothetical protein